MADIRTIAAPELHAWSVAVRRGFLNPSEVDDSEQRRALTPLERTWGAFEGNRIVATLRSFPVQITLPGARAIPAAAVTQVTTTATHRRQGLAGRLIAADLAACRERAEPLSVLIAAEWPIYGRWGYGPATESQCFTVDTRRTRMAERSQASVELVDVSDFRRAAAQLYDRVQRRQVGEISRPDWFWDVDLGILALPARPEVPPAFHLLARNCAGTVIGAARYRVETTWDAMLPAATVTVDMLVSQDLDTDRALWGYLLSLDLVTEVVARDRPVDEVLPWLLTDPRRARASKRHDFLWCRVVDVPAALSARRYRVDGRVVLDITDSQGLAAGRYELTGGPQGSECAPTTRSADLSLPVTTLGAIVLGGFSLQHLARVGWAEEHRTGSLQAADLMFSTSAAPWSSTWF
ncbi:MAG: GNAT family N-acetyltransferase [Geodermatophilaceae bacterium]|nr:GNAT family N-acetyltransferase [Geodermatophilaceae bacterium]